MEEEEAVIPRVTGPEGRVSFPAQHNPHPPTSTDAKRTADSAMTMTSPQWVSVMSYVSRRLRARVSSEASYLAADVQLDLVSMVISGKEVRSLYRLADCAIAKHLDRHARRRRRLLLGLDESAVAPAEKSVSPERGDGVELRPPIEKMPSWRLIRGRLERTIARGVWNGQMLETIAERIGSNPKEVRRVAKELPTKMARRHGHERVLRMSR